MYLKSVKKNYIYIYIYIYVCMYVYIKKFQYWYKKNSE